MGLKGFPSSLHLTAWEIGACPVLFAGTQTTMSLGWSINYLRSFCRDEEPPSSDNEEAEAKKPKLGEADPQDSGLRK